MVVILNIELEETLLQNFYNGLIHENRFFVNKEILEIFDIVIENCRGNIPAGEIIYRGRINSPINMTPYTDAEIGIPLADRTATSGRLNPYGIRYMYLAEDIPTVIAELRPNHLDYITIGYFKTNSSLEIVDLSTEVDADLKYQYHDTTVSIKRIVEMLSGKYLKPIESERKEIEYLPTQYFAEYCKSKINIDGIAHLSSVMCHGVEKHRNYALFESSKVEIVRKTVVSINSIHYNYEEL